jgi:hypothetical protein
MTTTSIVQYNPYKGTPPRSWVRLRFAAADGSIHERELLADTGSPCAVILGQADLGTAVACFCRGDPNQLRPIAGKSIVLLVLKRENR